MATSQLIAKQQSRIKSPIVDTNNCLNRIFPSFDNLNKELSSGFHLVNSFFNHFSFLWFDWKDPESLTAHWNKLNNIYKDSLTKQNIIFIIVDANIKNNIAFSISHTCRGQEIIAKFIHYTTNVNSTETELFAIRCKINHTVHLLDIDQIIIITDAILTAK